jgi:pimeloyl-ACP methyl ester carboxylesterase
MKKLLVAIGIDRRKLLAVLAVSPLAMPEVASSKSEQIAMQGNLGAVSASPTDSAPTSWYRTVDVRGLKIFYREAGPQDAPVLLLLHGYPSSSRMFEPLLPLLAKDFRLIAPDYPGFGLSQAPDPSVWQYTFDRLAQTMVDFADALGLKRYSMYLQDYGGPIGFRMALSTPERVQALIIQNAVLHEEGLTAVWNLRRAYWAQRAQNEPKIREGMHSVQAGVARHIGGRANPDRFNPDLWMDELAFLKRPGMDAIQLDLVYDYQSNVRAYPKWQAYLRDRRPPTLVVWGIHDPIFSVDGAQAIAREQPDAEIRWLEAGHFAINDQPDAIAEYIRTFLRRAIL